MGSLNIHIEPADVVAEALLVQEGYLIMDSSRKAIRMNNTAASVLAGAMAMAPASSSVEARRIRNRIRHLQVEAVLLEAEEEELDLDGWFTLQEIRQALPGLQMLADGRPWLDSL